MSILDNVTNRWLVEVKHDWLHNNVVTITELLDFIESFTSDVDPNSTVVIEGNSSGIRVKEIRDETEAEYDARMAENKRHAFERKQAADKSWAKQQKRFARARKNKS